MSEPGTQRPLRRDAERNRQRILAAAATVFTTQGLDASLDDVAREAGVGIGTVYRRFPDKESLVAELFTSRINAMAKAAEAAAEIPDPWDALVWFITEVTDTFSGDLGLQQMMMFGTYGTDKVSFARKQMRPAVTRLLKRAQAAGVVREDLAPTDIPFIAFMLSVTARYACDARPGIWRRYLALILDGFRPARDGTRTLPVPPLTPLEMERLIRGSAGGQPEGAPLHPAARTQMQMHVQRNE